MPMAPSVTTLSSATAGELRGPMKPLSAPPQLGDSYLSDQTSLPSAAARQLMTSSPPLRVKTYSLSPTRAGVATPSPTFSDHFFVSSLGQALGAVNPVTLASRLAPRHCGQSWAPAVPAPNSTTQ